LEGRIQQREYMDRDQNKRTSFDIVCNTFRMLGGRGEGGPGAPAGGGYPEEGEAPPPSPAAPAEEFSQGAEVSDEDIPF
jgi:single-stranded DNA-binding protein